MENPKKSNMYKLNTITLMCNHFFLKQVSLEIRNKISFFLKDSVIPTP